MPAGCQSRKRALGDVAAFLQWTTKIGEARYKMYIYFVSILGIIKLLIKTNC